MREILFRGKMYGNGAWVYGYFFADTADCLMKKKGECICPHDGSDAAILFWSDLCHEYLGAQVDSSTVGQYTGLNDTNGQKIFEGDVVQCMSAYFAHCDYVKNGRETQEQAEAYKDIGGIGVVAFSTEEIGSCGCCYPKFEGSGFTAGPEVCLSCCRVLGNIHDNPELLGGKDT